MPVGGAMAPGAATLAGGARRGAGGSKWTQPAVHALLEQTRQLGGSAAIHALAFSC